MTTAFSFSGSAPQAPPAAAASSMSGGQGGTLGAFGQAQQGFSTGLNAPNANGNGAAAPATSNPFGAPSGNPFKAASPAPTAPAFGSTVSSTPTSSATAPANPFQAAINANPSPAFGTATAQPAASPFANATASTPSPFQAAQPSSRGTSPNPFTALSQQPAPAVASPIGSTPTLAAASPFGNTPAPASTSPFGNTQTPPTTATGLSGFQQTPATTGFGQPTSQATGFGQPTSASNPFGQPVPTATGFGQPTTFGASSQPSSNPFMASPNPTPTPSVSPFSGTTHTTPTSNPAAAKTAAKKSVHFNLDPVSSQSTQTNGFGKPKPSLAASSSRFSSQPTLSAPPKEPQSDYAQKIMAQLQKDRLKPPQWPADPGNPANASAMEAFWVSYGNYRDKVRNSLVKAGLIDDPKVRKRLDEAIDFKGICDEMCPEFEKIERIQQHNVMMAEKSESPDGTMWPSPSLMVKALTRSSAGQEAPLPMDVRTVTALKRTLDHLIDDVLGDDSRLPAVHNFLWDRTRAIRRDFIFHSNMSEDEMLQQIYCLETITRFHATSLHLLSQNGFAPEGFDQRQEREQLSKALLSLLQAYDDCKDRRITCRNECEFRAYFILLNAHDPNFQHKVAEWGMELWYASDDVQTAMTLAQAMQSIWDWRGPIKPTMPTTTSLGAFATFFRIIESPQISYTMACVAEMHFVHVRRGILRNMTRAYARARDSPKDLTIQALNDMLRFDTVDEAWDFVIENKLEFSSDDKATAYLVLDKAVAISSMPIAQSFSQNLVERKRAGRSLPEALHNTVYEDPSKAPHLVTAPTATKDSDLFVSQSQAQVNTAPTQTVSKPTTAFPTTNSSTSILGPAAPSTTTPASAPSIFSQPPAASSTTPAPASSIFSQLNSGVDKKAAAPSLFQTPTAANSKANAPSTVPAASTSVFTSPFSTTPTSSPAKTNSSFITGAPTAASSIFDTNKPPATAAPATSIFSQPPTAVSSTSSAPAASVLSQPPPASSTSFSALFPASSTSAVADNKSTTAASPAAQSNPLFTTSAAKKAGENSSVLDATTKPSTFLGQPATTPATSALAPTAQPPKAPTQKPVSPPPPPPAPKTDLMGDFTKWFVLGDNGILGEFKEAFVEHLVRQTYEQFQRDEEERIKREEDEKSWAEALRFKTYNLRVKFFYRWRQIARERALDRRARQARDELKAYRAAKRAEQRAAAEKAAADEREKAAEARRMGSKEVKFLEELGYYGDFGASSRKRKASVGGVGDVGGVGAIDGLDDSPDASRARSVSLSVVEPHQAASASLSPLQQQLQMGQQGDEPPRRTRLPVRSIKEGISHTVSRAKELLSSRATSNGSSDIQYTRRHRGSIGSIGSIDGASISGDSLRSVRSSFSPDGTKFAYYRRSIPGKSRAKSFFTRVPSGTDLTAAADATTPPKKMTNFMRYSKKNNFGFGTTTGSSVSGGAGSGAGGIEKTNRWSSPGIRARPSSTARPATATMSPSPSSHASFSTSVAGSGVGGLSQSGGSKVKSSYWRLRAMGMVQMPNKQYLHESLALPMLQDGKRFPGVGNYGLPPVPTWQDADSAAKKDERQLVGSGDGRPFAINDDANNAVDANDDNEDEDESAESRARRYAEERMRRTSVTPSRKRMFSSGDGQDGTIGAIASNAARRPATATATAIAATAAAAASLTSPPGAKKARVSASPNDNINNSGSSSSHNNYNNYSSSTLSEAERIIQEMREMADAMDKDRDWYREQTELMKSGTSAWDE